MRECVSVSNGRKKRLWCIVNVLHNLLSLSSWCRVHIAFPVIEKRTIKNIGFFSGNDFWVPCVRAPTHIHFDMYVDTRKHNDREHGKKCTQRTIQAKTIQQQRQQRKPISTNDNNHSTRSIRLTKIMKLKIESRNTEKLFENESESECNRVIARHRDWTEVMRKCWNSGKIQWLLR